MDLHMSKKILDLTSSDPNWLFWETVESGLKVNQQEWGLYSVSFNLFGEPDEPTLIVSNI